MSLWLFKLKMIWDNFFFIAVVQHGVIFCVGTILLLAGEAFWDPQKCSSKSWRHFNQPCLRGLIIRKLLFLNDFFKLSGWILWGICDFVILDSIRKFLNSYSLSYIISNCVSLSNQMNSWSHSQILMWPAYSNEKKAHKIVLHQ